MSLNTIDKILVELNNTWYVSFDLALIISQWISPHFMINLNNIINKNLQDKKENELNNKNLKKQKRQIFPNDCVYIITNEYNENKRTYIIGKAMSLTDRLSNYNKALEHKVIYYKKCQNIEMANLVESKILEKLEKYKEIPNRDRFILPPGENILFFIDAVDEIFNNIQKINSNKNININV